MWSGIYLETDDIGPMLRISYILCWGRDGRPARGYYNKVRGSGGLEQIGSRHLDISQAGTGSLRLV